MTKEELMMSNTPEGRAYRKHLLDTEAMSRTYDDTRATAAELAQASRQLIDIQNRGSDIDWMQIEGYADHARAVCDLQARMVVIDNERNALRGTYTDDAMGKLREARRDFNALAERVTQHFRVMAALISDELPD